MTAGEPEAPVAVGADSVDVRALMAEVAKEVQRKREAGLYPPEVLVELDLGTPGSAGTAAPRAADDAQIGATLADLQRSSHFTALVTTASRKPVVAPLITAARRAIRGSLTWYMNGILEQIARFAGSTVRAIGMLNERDGELGGRIDAVTERVTQLEEWRADMERERVIERLTRLDRAARDLRAKLEEGSGATPDQSADRAGAWSWKAESSFDYLEFENRFRGDPQAIAERQRFYLDLFQGATKPVVDLGCGRGEFVGLLLEAGIPAYGVDRHPAMLEVCREKGLGVVEDDSLEHLAAVEAGSLGGIFCAQMIEHLVPGEVPKFFELANRALADGAPLVVETINPESLFVFAHAFYVDLGHLRPLHPLTLEFLAQLAGFTRVKVEYLAPPPPEFRPQKLPPPPDPDALGPLVDTLDENFRRIDEILFGPQDFAVVAHK